MKMKIEGENDPFSHYSLLAQPVVIHCLPLPSSSQLAGDHPSLLLAMISLRLFPMSPNWLLNIASPLLGVPVPLFFTSVLLGR